MKTIGDAECRVIAALLDRAANEFSNHGCTDFNLERLVPNLADRRAIMREYEEHNSKGADFDPAETFENVDDWILMGHFARKLRKYPKPPAWCVPGARVHYHAITNDPPTLRDTTIRSEPWQLGHGEWVVSIVGKAGGVSCQALSRADLPEEPAPPRAETAFNERLREAVERTAEGITHGAKIRGLELPPDFALERARNIVSALVDLFQDAEEAGFARGIAVGAPVGDAIDRAIKEAP